MVRPGTYIVASTVNALSKRLDIHGEPGPRPRIVLADGQTTALQIGGAAGAGTVLRHLEIIAPGNGVRADGVSPGTATLEDLLIRATDSPASGGQGVVMNGGGFLLRDSVVQIEETAGIGVSLIAGNAELRNVTVVATGADGVGLSATDAPITSACAAVGAATTLTVKNTIARGGATDVSVADLCGGSTPTVVNAANTNYRAARIQQNPPNATVRRRRRQPDRRRPPVRRTPGPSTTTSCPARRRSTPASAIRCWARVTSTVSPAPSARIRTSARTSSLRSPGACQLADLRAPRASRMSVRPSVFLGTNSGGSVARTRARRTRVRYRLDETATLTFTVERRATGRRVGRRCLAPTRRNRGRRRCTRYVRLRGSFNHRGRTGANSFRFTGRLRRRKLRPARYRLVGVPRDAAGNRGRPVRATFRIVRR